MKVQQAREGNKEQAGGLAGKVCHLRDALPELAWQLYLLRLRHMLQHVLHLCMRGRWHAHAQAPAPQRVYHLHPDSAGRTGSRRRLRVCLGREHHCRCHNGTWQNNNFASPPASSCAVIHLAMLALHYCRAGVAENSRPDL